MQRCEGEVISKKTKQGDSYGITLIHHQAKTKDGNFTSYFMLMPGGGAFVCVGVLGRSGCNNTHRCHSYTSSNPSFNVLIFSFIARTLTPLWRIQDQINIYHLLLRNFIKQNMGSINIDREGEFATGFVDIGHGPCFL